jgi:DNA-binding response OmpR family regulator
VGLAHRLLSVDHGDGATAVKDIPGRNSVPWLASPRALVAAGDSQSRRHLKEALSRVGYSADVCSDSGMILEHPHAASHSLLILEGGAAAMDVVRQLRARGADIPVILLSGGPQAEAGGDLRTGLAAHLTTPFTLKSLRRAINKVTRCPD